MSYVIRVVNVLSCILITCYMKSFSLALLLLCGSAMAQVPITLPLTVVNTPLPKGYIQVGTSQYTDLTRFRGVPANLTEKVLRTAVTVAGQASYESFLRGEIDRATWEQTRKRVGADTIHLSRKPLKQQINTLVGTNTTGQRVVIVDANNNQDFSDDKVLTYALELPQIPKKKDGTFDNTSMHAVLDTLPAVSVIVEAYDGRQIIQRTVWFKPVPYNTGWHYPNPEENRFHLSLLSHEYRQANTVLMGQPVQFLIITTPGLGYNTKSARIEIREAGQAVNKLLSEGPYQPGYTFILANHVLEITRLSVQGDQLTILDKGLMAPAR